VAAVYYTPRLELLDQSIWLAQFGAVDDIARILMSGCFLLGCLLLAAKVNNRVSLGLVPDRVFALVSGKESPGRSPSFFFLEADRGTMPVVRTNLSQSSFHRKLLAYQATWAQGVARSHFGFHRFRVLTVTTSAARVKSLIDACSQLKRGRGLFLFADRTILEKPGLFSLPWKTGSQGKTTRLLP
jgi:hypothetical protein